MSTFMQACVLVYLAVFMAYADDEAKMLTSFLFFAAALDVIGTAARRSPKEVAS